MEDLEESDRSWLKQMEETKSKDKILYHMLELLYSTKSYRGSKETADNKFGLLLKLLPVQLVDTCNSILTLWKELLRFFWNYF